MYVSIIHVSGRIFLSINESRYNPLLILRGNVNVDNDKKKKKKRTVSVALNKIIVFILSDERIYFFFSYSLNSILRRF